MCEGLFILPDLWTAASHFSGIWKVIGPGQETYTEGDHVAVTSIWIAAPCTVLQAVNDMLLQNQLGAEWDEATDWGQWNYCINREG